MLKSASKKSFATYHRVGTALADIWVSSIKQPHPTRQGVCGPARPVELTKGLCMTDRQNIMG